MHQAHMVHHRQMEDMQEHKLTAAIPLAITMVLLGSKLVALLCPSVLAANS